MTTNAVGPLVDLDRRPRAQLPWSVSERKVMASIEQQSGDSDA